MPESSANQHEKESKYQSVRRWAERLATPQELAEFGASGPDPAVEAEILGLLEVQISEEQPPEEQPPETIGTDIAGKVLEPAIIEVPLDTPAANAAEASSEPVEAAA